MSESSFTSAQSGLPSTSDDSYSSDYSESSEATDMSDTAREGYLRWFASMLGEGLVGPATRSRVRTASSDNRAPQELARWSEFPSTRMFHSAAAGAGLSPARIQALASAWIWKSPQTHDIRCIAPTFSVHQFQRASAQALHRSKASGQAAVHYRRVAARLVPNQQVGTVPLERTGRVYNAQFSRSGKLFLTMTQDHRMLLHQVGGTARDVKFTAWRETQAQHVQWTVTSIDMSPDEQFAVYSSITPTLHLVKVTEDPLVHTPLLLDAQQAWSNSRITVPTSEHAIPGPGLRSSARLRSQERRPNSQRPPPPGMHEEQAPDASAHVGTDPAASSSYLDAPPGDARRFAGGMGIWTTKFSHGGAQLVAGASNNCILVYDIEAGRTTECVPAHLDDINAVAFLDSPASANVIVSGSDDCMIKVWDRRTLRSYDPNSALASARARPRPVLYLPGHCGGVASLSSKADGYSLVSNGKDQCAKLWDARVGVTTTKWDAAGQSVWRWEPSYGSYDYRFEPFPGWGQPNWHPEDASVATYRGHRVQKTLVRAYFSPESTTGSSYIYTGSADGGVYIYEVLTGALVQVLAGHSDVVRDVSWHPHFPCITGASWDGEISVWGWDADPSTSVDRLRANGGLVHADIEQTGMSQLLARRGSELLRHFM